MTIVTSAMPSLDGLEQVDPSPSEALLARVLWITIFSFGRPTNFLWAMASSMPIYGTFEWGKNGAMNLGSQLLEKSDIGGAKFVIPSFVTVYSTPQNQGEQDFWGREFVHEAMS